MVCCTDVQRALKGLFLNRTFYWFHSSQTPFSLRHGAKNEPLAVDYQCRPLCMQRHIDQSDMKPIGKELIRQQRCLFCCGFCQKARNILTDDKPVINYFFLSFLNVSFLRKIINAMICFNKTMILADVFLPFITVSSMTTEKRQSA